MYAIVLAGGKGERLRPFTEDRPKPMVEIVGIPILSYQLQWLQGQGVTDVVVSCGYRHEVIEAYFGDGERLGVRIAYSVEEQPLGRGGALRQALGCVPASEDVVVATNGDIITNLRLAPVLEAHRARGMLATVVLTPFVSPYGIVEIDGDGHVRRFRERGATETTTFPELARAGRLGAFQSRAYWRGVDTIKDVNEVAAELQRRLLSFFREG